MKNLLSMVAVAICLALFLGGCGGSSGDPSSQTGDDDGKQDSAAQSRWLANVKSEFLKIFNADYNMAALTEAAREDLPALVQEFYDDYYDLWEPSGFSPIGFQFKVDAKTALGLRLYTEEYMYVHLFDAKGKLIAHGKVDENNEMSWFDAKEELWNHQVKKTFMDQKVTGCETIQDVDLPASVLEVYKIDAETYHDYQATIFKLVIDKKAAYVFKFSSAEEIYVDLFNEKGLQIANGYASTEDLSDLDWQP